MNNKNENTKKDMKTKLVGAKIIGIGGCLPKKKVDNSHYEKYLDTTDEWIRVRTGIEYRYIAEEETLTDLAAGAAIIALEKAGKTAQDIDLLIVATTTSDNIFPSCSTRVHGVLGMRKDAMAFDVAAACNGFIYALNLARLYFIDNTVNTIMIIGADKMSQITDQYDRSTAMLFADGAGAFVMERTNDDVGFLGYDLNTDGSGYELLYVNGGPGVNSNISLLEKEEGVKTENIKDNKINNVKESDNKISCVGKIKMDGSAIFKLAIISMADSIMKSVEKSDLKLDDIDLIVSHQANVRIIDAIVERLGVDPSKAVRTVNMHGNTSAASIPLAIHQYQKDGVLDGKKNVVFCGFGAGLTWGSVVMKIS